MPASNMAKLTRELKKAKEQETSEGHSTFIKIVSINNHCTREKPQIIFSLTLHTMPAGQ